MRDSFTGLAVNRGGTGLFVHVGASFGRASVGREDVDCPIAARAFAIFDDLSHVLERQFGVMDKATAADLITGARVSERFWGGLKPDEKSQIEALLAEYQGLIGGASEPAVAEVAL